MYEFSFSKEVRSIPFYIQGIDRVSEISNLIIENPEWRVEGKKAFDDFLKTMVELEASDIDLGGTGALGQVWFRVEGRKFPSSDLDTLHPDDATALICCILSERKIDSLMISFNADFSYKLNLSGEDKALDLDKVNRFRADAYLDLDYLGINLRRINPTPFDINGFGFAPNVLQRFDLDYEKKGLILVTGITGSGKSTTLDAIIDMNNHKSEAHITIIGSPIEYFHKSRKSIVRHREVGRDTLSFKDGSIEALRQDPDIIVIGEMRDPETIMTALEITDSGHKVFSTLHTGSAVESVHRIVAECPVDEQNRVRMRLADVLSVVVSQKLVPSKSGKRVLAKEVLVVTPSVMAAIMNNNITEIYQMITEGKEHGMCTLEQDLFRLFMNKVISKEVAISYANNKKRIIELIQYYANRMR